MNGLYIVATPIGNLKDISARAKEVLEQADVIACEDTRVSKKLFLLLGLNTKRKFVAYHDHNETDKMQDIIDIICSGKSVALISDAGSPLISDPGYKLVRQCRKLGIYVSTIPGACALISALQLSGLPTNRFLFAGFIPNKDKARQNFFAEFKNINATLIFYETAPRLLKSLNAAKEVFFARQVSVAREITKIHEEVFNGSFDETIAHFEQFEPKGEFVLMLSSIMETEDNTSVDDVTDILKERMSFVSLKTAVKEISEKYKLSKTEVYDLALRIKNEQL